MRKLILISAFVLASVSAQAGENRNMTLAANDETKAVETAQPEATSAPQTNVDTKTDVKPTSPRPTLPSRKAQGHTRPGSPASTMFEAMRPTRPRRAGSPRGMASTGNPPDRFSLVPLVRGMFVGGFSEAV